MQKAFVVPQALKDMKRIYVCEAIMLYVTMFDFIPDDSPNLEPFRQQVEDIAWTFILKGNEKGPKVAFKGESTQKAYKDIREGVYLEIASIENPNEVDFGLALLAMLEAGDHDSLSNFCEQLSKLTWDQSATRFNALSESITFLEEDTKVRKLPQTKDEEASDALNGLTSKVAHGDVETEETDETEEELDTSEVTDEPPTENNPNLDPDEETEEIEEEVMSKKEYKKAKGEFEKLTKKHNKKKLKGKKLNALKKLKLGIQRYKEAKKSS